MKKLTIVKKINTSFCLVCYKIGTQKEISNHKCLGKRCVKNNKNKKSSKISK